MANAASGAAVNDQCRAKFTELQAKKLHRFIIYKVEDSKEIVVDVVGERTACYEDFLGVLPENDCRYAVFDFDYLTPDDILNSKIFYIFWSPDTARVRSKMTYASSNEKFKRIVDGYHFYVQATDNSEVSFDCLKGKLNGHV